MTIKDLILKISCQIEWLLKYLHFTIGLWLEITKSYVEAWFSKRLWATAKGADINAQGRFYGSALQAASLRGYQEVLRILKKAGASA